MKVIPYLAAFLLACFVVAVIWSGAASIWGTRKAGPHDVFEDLFIIFGLVASVSALPALALSLWARLRNRFSYASAALGGFVIGAGMFIMFFSYWVSDNPLRGYAELIATGGGLGLCGGLVFMYAHGKLSRMIAPS